MIPLSRFYCFLLRWNIGWWQNFLTLLNLKKLLYLYVFQIKFKLLSSLCCSNSFFMKHASSFFITIRNIWHFSSIRVLLTFYHLPRFQHNLPFGNIPEQDRVQRSLERGFWTRIILPWLSKISFLWKNYCY